MLKKFSRCWLTLVHKRWQSIIFLFSLNSCYWLSQIILCLVFFSSVDISWFLSLTQARSFFGSYWMEKIWVKTKMEIADEQAGFRQGRGTKDQITNLRILMHKACEHQQPLYMCFVDFKKVFDSISDDKLWVTMMDILYTWLTCWPNYTGNSSLRSK